MCREIGGIGVVVAATAAILSVKPVPSTLVAQAADPAFEVASIKVNRSGDLRSTFQPLPGGRFTATNIPLRAVIRYAYRIQDFQIEGAPGWLTADRFDIAATGDAKSSMEQVRLMVRAFLEERLKLKMHSVMRELPSYALVMARSDRRNGPRLRRTEADCANAAPAVGPPAPGESPSCAYIGPLPGSNFQAGRAAMAFRGLTMEALARFLVPLFGRSVVDRTGLAGYFDGEFDPTAEFGPPPPPPGVPDPFDRQSFPSIFTVFPEQLGLKLEGTRAPVDVLVIDFVERPSED